MNRHIVGAFPDANAVHQATEALISEGTPGERISVMRWSDPDHGEKLLEYDVEERTEAIRAGFWSGGALGAVAGLLAGAIGLLAAPIGFVAILGPLASAFGGAAIGATVGEFVGSLRNLGLSREDAERYFEMMEGGAILLAVAVTAAETPAIKARVEALGATEVTII
jgi:hypothetical protein